MFKKRFWAIAIVFAILLSISALAEDGALTGIAAESPAYAGYNACIDSCENCADNCRSNAYRMAAEIDSNEELCSQLPEGMKEMCINRVYASKASAAKDSALCERISMKEERSMCVLNVQIEKAISSKDKAECSSAPDGLENACTYAYEMRQALESRDEAGCNAANQREGRAKQHQYNATRIVSNSLFIIALAAIGFIIIRAAIKRRNEISQKKIKPAKKKRG